MVFDVDDEAEREAIHADCGHRNFGHIMRTLIRKWQAGEIQHPDLPTPKSLLRQEKETP